MTADPLRRLIAGLAEEERTARATRHPHGEEDTLEWQTAGRRHLSFDNGRGENYQAVFCGTWPGPYAWDRIMIARDDGSLAKHVARQDPKATLDRVEAIQRLLRRHEEAERDSALSDRDAGFEAGLYAALEALASIYPEGTDETENEHA